MTNNSNSSDAIQIQTRSADGTRTLGRAIGRVLEPGDVVLLGGEMGVGKTTLTAGIAEALDVTEPVTSPTFILVRELDGRMPLAHIDLYRLDRVQEIENLGLDEILDGRSVVVVEWGDIAGPAFGADGLDIALEYGEPGADEDRSDVREVAFSGRGPRWARRWAQMHKVLEALT